MVVSLLARASLICVVPVGALFVGDHCSNGCLFASLLTFISCVYEVHLFLTSQKNGRSAKSKRKGRPWQIFVLQLLTLYMVQLWSITLDAGWRLGSQEHAAEQESIGRRPATLPSADASVPVPAFEPAVPVDSQPEKQELKEVPSPVQPSAGVPSPVQPSSAASGAFELDAPLASLSWHPKTISVVLPCAEERDLALSTVKSVYESTPSDILHEIVVVDDGSNPPLAQTHLTEDKRRQYKVKMERHEQTVGLIGAKKTGGDSASGDLVIFFDCHVAPQKDWYKDFFNLISVNYRRMVIPQITALDVDTWTQVGSGGGMSKCYVTWDGDFKWGGTDDMYMGMLSGGLLGMSKRWWDESGGYDSQMFGWGGENIDQGIRMWVCGGEIVAAPNSQVAHMWRTGAPKTNARYRHVGDTFKNRARAIYAWFGEFSDKLDHYPNFASRKRSEGNAWYGDMSNFQKVKDRLQGCRPFAWYLRRFKVVYEDAGIIPREIFMLKETKSGLCLFFQGQAGTSSQGAEGVVLQDCNPKNHRFFWHLGNRNPSTHACCSGFRAWNTDQCLQGGQGGGMKGITGICDLSGTNNAQQWKLRNGLLRRGGSCLGLNNGGNGLIETPCAIFNIKGGSRFTKISVEKPLETQLYEKSQREHPEVFKKLNEELAQLDSGASDGRPPACKKGACVSLMLADGSNRCLSEDGTLTDERDSCAAMIVNGNSLRLASDDRCLDSWSDANAETWGFYGCHGGGNQQFHTNPSGNFCEVEHDNHCLEKHSWPPESTWPEAKQPAPAEAGSASQYVLDASDQDCPNHIVQTVSSGNDDCASKCTANPDCKYYSVWSSGWCRQSRECGTPQARKGVKIYRKQEQALDNFELDAPPESLKWEPHTISIVLPCAEERDLAMKTVKSCYEATPEYILHEIVVVDDGSNPPLSTTHLTAEIQKKYKVLIKRHEQTVGLIGAKKTGGDAATGDIVVFFDCHVAPQREWYEDFIALISVNYRRMVIPQITALDIDSWQQIGSGGGMSKCYVTWDGDFKWGGTDDMYMGMLSGGLLGMSKRWWSETGGYDEKMLGWGGENIDQGIRMWVCGGEIVAAPRAQVAHMWRTGDSKTRARYHHVGDTIKNRARAVSAWMGEFAGKLDHYPTFASRKNNEGSGWIGDMSSFQKVKDRLQGCRPFAWYLRRFKTVYEDAGIVPPEIFMIKDESSNKCLLYQGTAGTSGAGREGVVLAPCNPDNHRFFWHMGNRDPHSHKCCSGLRAWNTDQCFQGINGRKGLTGICELSGSNYGQHWAMVEMPQDQFQLRHGDGSGCIAPGDSSESLEEGSCDSFSDRGGALWSKYLATEPLETELYKKSQREHPEVFRRLDNEQGPPECRDKGPCVKLFLDKRCLAADGSLTDKSDDCALVVSKDAKLRLAKENDRCLDTMSDDSADTWVFYGCHEGTNQEFSHPETSKFCSAEKEDQCFETRSWNAFA